MDIEAIWLLIIIASAPIGAVVGFGLQLRKLEQERLRNSLLEIELKEARRRLEQAENVIVRATPEEIKTYGAGIKGRDVMFSLGRGPSPGPDGDRPVARTPWSRSVMEGLVVGMFFAVVAYLLYDVYRVARWLYGLL